MFFESTKRKVGLKLAAAVAAVVLAGCSTNKSGEVVKVDTSSSVYEQQSKEQQARLAALETQLQERDRQISGFQTEITTYKNAASAAQGQSAAMNSGSSSLFPPNPAPGECYARVLIPATYATTTEKVLKSEGGEKVRIIPAKYAPGTERVVDREASSKIVVIPATYRTVTEEIVVKPASTRLVEVPAKYKTVNERKLIKPATTVWKRGSGIGGAGAGANGGGSSARLPGTISTRISEDTGELMCLVEVPAVYKTVTRREVLQPAATKTIEIPAVTKKVTRRIVAEPATTKEIPIPATYKTVKVQKLVEPAREVRVPIPAQYANVTKRVKKTEEAMEWRKVLCKTNMTPKVATSLQSRLKTAGFYSGSVDGVFGPQTVKAVNSYASKNGLPSGSNYITLETMKALKVAY